MTHLLDTDICIYWFKGSRPILEHAEAFHPSFSLNQSAVNGR